MCHSIHLLMLVTKICISDKMLTDKILQMDRRMQQKAYQSMLTLSHLDSFTILESLTIIVTTRNETHKQSNNHGD